MHVPIDTRSHREPEEFSDTMCTTPLADTFASAATTETADTLT